MATTKSRINVSLPEEVKKALSEVARRDHVPAATKAARLLEFALEIEEDAVWNAIASKRDAKKVHYISHSKAWK